MPERHVSPFLARRAYRRRRLMDVARLLPVLGAAGFILPVLMAGRDLRSPVWFAGGLEAFLGLWALLVMVSFLVGRGLGPAIDAPEEALSEEPAPDKAEGDRRAL